MKCLSIFLITLVYSISSYGQELKHDQNSIVVSLQQNEGTKFVQLGLQKAAQKIVVIDDFHVAKITLTTPEYKIQSVAMSIEELLQDILQKKKNKGRAIDLITPPYKVQIQIQIFYIGTESKLVEKITFDLENQSSDFVEKDLRIAQDQESLKVTVGYLPSAMSIAQFILLKSQEDKNAPAFETTNGFLRNTTQPYDSLIGTPSLREEVTEQLIKLGVTSENEENLLYSLLGALNENSTESTQQEIDGLGDLLNLSGKIGMDRTNRIIRAILSADKKRQKEGK